jgi:uncharacterized protein DUF6694
MPARNLSLLLTLLLFAFGCSKPTIDTSSDEAMNASMKAARESLPEERRKEFDDAVRDLALAELSFKDLMAQGENPKVDVLSSRFKERLKGKNAEQVIAEAAKLREERARKEREQALGEISELEKKAAAAQAAKQQLAAFQVTRSRFYRYRSGFLEEPVIELSISNGTPHAISRAYFHGTVASPGRSVPWVSEDFNYSIPGGLEPGESATWKLKPNMFSAWGTKTPPDAVLTVEVVRLDGPDSKALFDAAGLDDSEKERLAELKKKYLSK